MALKREPIHLRQKRDFGQIISDSFAFIVQQAKPLFKIVLLLSGIFMLGTWASNSLYQIQAVKTYGSSSVWQYSSTTVQVFGLPYFLLMIFTLLSTCCIMLATLSYLKVYDESKGGAVEERAVWDTFKKLFFKYIIATIAYSIMWSIGFVLCIIPGIYLLPIVLLTYPILVFENLGIGDLYNRSSALIRENWWKTFGTLLLAMLVTSMCAYIFMLPSLLLTIFSVFLQSNGWLSNGLTIVASFISAFGQLTYMFAAIAITLCYFSLKEEKEGTGLMDRIEQFGGRDGGNDEHLPQEEY